MPSRARQLALLIRKLEARITDLEQERPPDAPVRLVSTNDEAGVEAGPEVVATSAKADFAFKYDIRPNGYDEAEWVDVDTAPEPVSTEWSEGEYGAGEFG